MDLKTLDNTQLMNRFGKLLQTERKITHLVLDCISEIDLRKIYLERAYPSLFDFLVKAFGYSPSAAARRIESARLLREVPEIAVQIKEGALNLTQLSQVQKAIRETQKQDSRKVPSEKKREILKKIENTTQSETELILAQEFNLPIVTDEREKIHRNESVTLMVTFSKEQILILERARSLMSHSLPDNKWAEVFTTLAEKEIKLRSEIKRKPQAQRESAAPGAIKTDLTPVTEVNLSELPISGIPFTRESIPANTRKAILQKDQCCQFKDPLTNRICGSRWFLEIDHIQPVWAGGDNSPDNLRILCSAHNKFKYGRESGRYFGSTAVR